MANNSLNLAERVAKLLLEIKAVTLSPNKPYKFVSGIISPIYTDNRLLMGFPLKRKEITIYMANLIHEKGLEPEIIAGTSTAGIPPAAWLAELLNLPMVYVRSEKKDHGKGKQVEGLLPKRVKVLLIEDLISTGKSSLGAIRAIQAAGGKVDTCLAILNYQLKEAKNAYQKMRIDLFTLTNLEAVILMAQKLGLINDKEKKLVEDWNNDPRNWGNRIGQTVEY